MPCHAVSATLDAAGLPEDFLFMTFGGVLLQRIAVVGEAQLVWECTQSAAGSSQGNIWWNTPSGL